MSAKSFGLDIGATTMKVVSLTPSDKGYVIDAVMTGATPPKGMLSESTLDQEEMGRAIKKLLTDAKITSKYVNIALPENQVYTKVIEMPVLSDKELASAIYWEAEQYIPVPLSTITLDYSVLHRPKANEAGEKMFVLLAGAPTQLINKYEKVMNKAGLSINAVETEILSTVRSLVIGEGFPTSLIMNIGALSTSIAIVRGGTVMFTYVIPSGGMAISRAIAADFGFSVQQADQYKKTYGLSQENFGGKIGKATQPILQSIMGEIRKSMIFYQGRYKDDAIKLLIIAGGTAKLPGLNTYFTNNLGIEASIANPWKVLAPQQVPKDIIDNAADYTVAVGLAMYE